MKRRQLIKQLASTILVLASNRFARAETFLTEEQAKGVLFPGRKLTPIAVELTSEQKSAIRKASGVRVRDTAMRVLRSSDGGWLIFDNVIGKHEFIDIAVALTSSGAVKGVEVLTFRETYGDEVKYPKWRAQFHGKTTAQPVQIDADIKNISGATLSCVHITDGVRRLLHTHALVLKNL
jgi:Na+-translocating ferredoxin:NAD+ oxidoreductase RnfG subunit